MSISIEPFEAAHVDDVARLAAARAARLRRAIPLLAEEHEHPDGYHARLERILNAGPAFVALDGGRVVGHLASWLGAGRGLRWAFSPEWANGTGGDDQRRTLEALYTRAAASWVASGVRTHLVALPVSEPAAAETLAWLGFGLAVADAVRDVGPLDEVPAAPASVAAIRPAGVEDARTIMALERRLRAHLAASPIFFVLGPERALEEHRMRLRDPASTTLLASEAEADAPIAYLRIGPVADDVAGIVQDPGTASITGAFTLSDRRGRGVATALLATAVDWARGRGYARCAVDFESMNVEARRFWLRWFTPVVLSMARRLDDPTR